MGNSRGSSTLIQSQDSSPVKGGALLVAAVAWMGISGVAWADQPIEARQFRVVVLQRSTSQRVFLMETIPPTEPLPPLGRILLLRKGSEPLIAVRILKQYPEPGRFAARRVQSYGTRQTLENRDTATALEKLGDVELSAVAPRVAAKDASDLQEIDRASQAIPAQPLPATPSAAVGVDTPPPPPPPEEGGEALTGTPAVEKPAYSPPVVPEEEESVEVSLEDERPLDPFKHWLTAAYGMLLDGQSYYSAGGVRYGYDVSHHVFATQKQRMDSLTLEGGLFLYRISGFQSTADAYSILTFLGTLRYNYFTSESFALFGYLGGSYAYATPTSTTANNAGANLLSGIGPAIGVGMVARIGPQWDLRADIGADIFGVGLVLRF